MSREKYEGEASQRSVQLKQISKDPTEAQVKEASLKVASFVSHDCESDFLSSAKLYDFQEDWTTFTEIGGPNSTAQKARRNKGNVKNKESKLVDITQMRAKFTVKINTVAKTVSTHLAESIAFYVKWRDGEEELMQKFTSCLEDAFL